MNDYTVNLQPAYILHARKYRETSLLLEVLTRDFGKLTLVAKGVRKTKSKMAGLLQPFILLNISYFGKRELKVLLNAEIIQPLILLTDVSLFCGFYINELLQNFLAIYDPHPEIFFDYRETLSFLAENNLLEKVLRIFEFNLLENVGYGLQLKIDASTGLLLDSDKRYEFDVMQGPIEQVNGPFSGAMMIALRNNNVQLKQHIIEAKKLLRTVIDYHLSYKQLNSRKLMMQHKKYMNSGVNE